MIGRPLVPLLGIASAVLVSVAASSSITAPAYADGVREAPRRAPVIRVHAPRKAVVYRKVYAYRENGWCAANMMRLRNFEREVRHDGRVSEDEMRIALSLKADLSYVCGRTHVTSSRSDRYR